MKDRERIEALLKENARLSLQLGQDHVNASLATTDGLFIMLQKARMGDEAAIREVRKAKKVILDLIEYSGKIVVPGANSQLS